MTDILKRLRAHAAKQESLSRERDALILEAKTAGVPVTHIAEAIGLHRTHVHRIVSQSNNALANAAPEGEEHAER